MHNGPSPGELLEAVKLFIDETVAPQLEGHAGFHARVASNALATVIRDIAARPQADLQERERLVRLLDIEAPLDELNRELSRRIQRGELDVRSHGLLDHMKLTAIAQVKVDQPRYSGLKAAL